MSRILLIEDDIQVRSMLKKMLTKAAYEVEDVSNGEEACEVLHVRGADLVVTDIFMPKKDGLETIFQFKQENPGLKIVAISGGAPGGSLNFLPLAESMGADLVLKKPFSQKTFLNAVKKLLEQE